jgi:hypothetical protein
MNTTTRLDRFYHYDNTIITLVDVSDFGVDYRRSDSVNPDRYRMDPGAFVQRLKDGIIYELELWEKAAFLLRGNKLR